MVELFWVACMRPTQGVLVFTANSASKRSGRIGDWEVLFLEGARLGSIPSDSQGQCLGYVSDVYPEAAVYRTMFGFLTDKFGDVYHGWVGYSQEKFTEDNQYHAIELFWQEPGKKLSDLYHWYVLRDVHEPADWYRASHILFCCNRPLQYQARL